MFSRDVNFSSEKFTLSSVATCQCAEITRTLTRPCLRPVDALENHTATRDFASGNFDNLLDLPKTHYEYTH